MKAIENKMLDTDKRRWLFRWRNNTPAGAMVDTKENQLTRTTTMLLWQTDLYLEKIMQEILETDLLYNNDLIKV
jgi:hypothetical protein